MIGATGGVGSFFVQLASLQARTSSHRRLAEDADYLTRDRRRRDPRPQRRPRNRARRPSGRRDPRRRLVRPAGDAALSASTRLASSNGAAGDGPGRFNLYAQPSPENLERLAGLLDAGTIRVSIQERFELAQAGEALGFLAAGHTRGKVAVASGSAPGCVRRARRRPRARLAPAAASARRAPATGRRRTRPSAAATAAPGSAAPASRARTRIHRAQPLLVPAHDLVRRMVEVGELGGGIRERAAAELRQLHHRLELDEEPRRAARAASSDAASAGPVNISNTGTSRLS